MNGQGQTSDREITIIRYDGEFDNLPKSAEHINKTRTTFKTKSHRKLEGIMKEKTVSQSRLFRIIFLVYI